MGGYSVTCVVRGGVVINVSWRVRESYCVGPVFDEVVSSAREALAGGLGGG